MCCELWGFPIWFVGIILILVRFWVLFPVILFLVLSSASGSFLVHEYWSVFCWILEGTLYRSLEFSLSTAPSRIYFFHQLRLPFSPQTFSSISSTQGICQVPPDLPLPALQPANSLKLINWALLGFTSFISHFRDHCSSVPGVQYLKTCCFTYLVCVFNYFRQNDKSRSCYSILTESSSLIRNFWKCMLLVLKTTPTLQLSGSKHDPTIN